MNIDKLTKKSIVMLIIGVTVFLITIVGSAYAFYQGNSTISFNNSNQSLAIPSKCTFLAYGNTSLGDCSFISDTLTGADATGRTGDPYDQYIEPKELVPRDPRDNNHNIMTDDYEIEHYYYDTQIAQSSCGYTISLSGEGCTCTYNLNLYSYMWNPRAGINFVYYAEKIENGISEDLYGYAPSEPGDWSRVWMGTINSGDTVEYRINFYADNADEEANYDDLDYLERYFIDFKFQTDDVECYKN